MRFKKLVNIKMLGQLLILLFVTTPIYACEHSPTVETPLGLVIGYHKKSFKGRKYEVYEGIPYAQPPVDDLRFEEAIPVSVWGVLNATKPKSSCAQYIDIAPDERGKPVTEGRVEGEDDCLYLNINVPILRDRSQKMPVIFFIHGGSYQYGSGAPFSTNNIYLTDRDVIFVSINYRLGVQGFLSTEDEVLPGNLGLKDQSLALRWTSENIGYFGGDPNKITLIGFSAGSSSVHYHYLSPLSRGLFHSGIAISGTAYNPWGFAVHAAEKAKKLGALFNCPTHCSRLMVDCLKTKPAQSLAAATKNFQYWGYMPEAPFAPVIEKAGSRPFINKSPEQIAEAGEMNDVPIVFGTVSNEGCDPGAAYAPHENLLIQLNDQWLSIAPHLLQYNYTLPKDLHEKVAKAAREKYFGNKNIDKNTAYQLIKLLTDVHYHIGIEKGVRLQAAGLKSPVYFYYYSYRGTRSYSEKLSHTKTNYGVCHCDDVLLVTEDSPPPTKTNEELDMVNLLMDMWETVANSGVPKLGIEWQPVNASDSEIKYLHIRRPSDYRMSGNSNLGEKKFWKKYFSLY